MVVPSNATLRIERDGTGSGLVRLAAGDLAVAGRLTGSGRLGMGAAGERTVRVDGVLSPGGEPGEAGMLAIDGGLALSAGATIEVDPAGDADTVVVSGDVAFGDTLNVIVGKPTPGFRSGSSLVLISGYANDPPDPVTVHVTMPPGWSHAGLRADAESVRLVGVSPGGTVLSIR